MCFQAGPGQVVSTQGIHQAMGISNIIPEGSGLIPPPQIMEDDLPEDEDMMVQDEASENSIQEVPKMSGPPPGQVLTGKQMPQEPLEDTYEDDEAAAAVAALL